MGDDKVCMRLQDVEDCKMWKIARCGFVGIREEYKDERKSGETNDSESGETSYSNIL